MIHKKGRPVRDGRQWLGAPRLHQQPHSSRHNDGAVRLRPLGRRNDERTPVVELCRYEQVVRAVACCCIPHRSDNALEPSPWTPALLRLPMRRPRRGHCSYRRRDGDCAPSAGLAPLDDLLRRR